MMTDRNFNFWKTIVGWSNPDGVANFGDDETMSRAHTVTIPDFFTKSVSFNVQPGEDSNIRDYKF